MNKQASSSSQGKIITPGCSVADIIYTSVTVFVLLGSIAVFFFYAPHGFDITDESFYLLWARQPERVLASSTQFGFYTRVLYLLSGENIAIFRIVGIVLLLCVTAFFSLSLKRYWMSLADITPEKCRGSGNSILILIGSLVYYASWLITPSYNWLALVSVLICGAGLLRFTSLSGKSISNQEWTSWELIDALLVGISGGIAFMAKPTTAFALALVTLFWLFVHNQKNRKKFLGFAVLSATVILLFHAVYFKGGLLSFYSELSEGIRLAKMLGGGHSVSNIFSQASSDIQSIPAFILSLFDVWWFVVFPVAFCIVWWEMRCNRFSRSFYLLFITLFSFLGMIWFHLWERGYWSRTRMGYSGITLLLVLLFCSLLLKLVWNKREKGIDTIPVMSLVKLCFFLLMLAASYAFGSANGLLRQMSGGYVFLVAGAVYIAFWMDMYVETSNCRYFVSTAVIVSVLVLLNKGIEKPYRLPGRLNEQNEEVSFLSGRGHLTVDHSTAKYIKKLKQIALNEGWVTGTPVIDLTGGSPGATLILDGRILGFPWLAGGYKGSREFVSGVLSLVSEIERRSAWVLTAPIGRRKNTTDILLDFNLIFPDHYKVVGEIQTGHRNELQVLWRPNTLEELARQSL